MPEGPVLTKNNLLGNAFQKVFFETGAIPDYAIPALEKIKHNNIYKHTQIQKRNG
jgi:hypothetical protein